MPVYKERATEESFEGMGFEVRIFVSGRKEYYFNGVLHKTDGPAITWPSGLVSWDWYINGACLNKKDFIEGGVDFIVKMKALELFTPLEILQLRNKCSTQGK